MKTVTITTTHNKMACGRCLDVRCPEAVRHGTEVKGRTGSHHYSLYQYDFHVILNFSTTSMHLSGPTTPYQACGTIVDLLPDHGPRYNFTNDGGSIEHVESREREKSDTYLRKYFRYEGVKRRYGVLTILGITPNLVISRGAFICNQESSHKKT